MAMRERNLKSIVKNHSIGTVLWFSLISLLFIVIVALSIGQSILLSSSYRDQVKTEQLYVCREIYEDLNGKENLDAQYVNAYIIRKVISSGESIYVFNASGEVIFPFSGAYDEENDYAKIFTNLTEKILKYTDGKIGDSVGYMQSKHYCRACVFNVNGQLLYLYLSADASLGGEMLAPLISQIIFVGFVVIILSFLFAAMISSGIGDPITSINKKAKKLAKGDFSVDFKDDAYGSYMEISELSETLNYARDELSKADSMQKELIANVSHDFKTPLTMIKAYASMIQEISGEDPEKRNKHCQVIINESDRLANLVNDMLDISKIRSGINALKSSVFNLSEYTVDIIDRFGYLTESQGYTFNVDVTPDLFTEADKDKIGQVIYNLVGNAVNYTGDDKTIYIRLYEMNGVIRFDVRDTGVGIKKEDIDTIWDRYYRSKETHKRPIKGTGLGLSIVKAILTKHGFNFGVTSEIGVGSVFFVDFPHRAVWDIESDQDEENN